MTSKYPISVVSLALLTSVCSQSVDGEQYDSPSAGPPSSFFSAATTIPISALQTAAAKASQAAEDATYPINNSDDASEVTIHSDWSDYSEVSLFFNSLSLTSIDPDINLII